MGKVKELADREAERAEAEPDEPDEPDTDADDGEGAGTDAPGAEPSGDPTAEDMAAFAAEHERHADVLRSIMGDDFAALVECDECGGMGYAPPMRYKTNDRYIGCETCAGLGAVLTGSKVETSATAQCPSCMGRGYLEKLTPTPTHTEHAAQQANGTDQYGNPTWMGSPDVKPEPIYGPPS